MLDIINNNGSIAIIADATMQAISTLIRARLSNIENYHSFAEICKNNDVIVDDDDIFIPVQWESSDLHVAMGSHYGSFVDNNHNYIVWVHHSDMMPEKIFRDNKNGTLYWEFPGSIHVENDDSLTTDIAVEVCLHITIIK